MKNKYDIIKNPSTEDYLEISEAIEANEGYCCCAIQKNDDSKCMCKIFRESEATDYCHCGRYYKVKNYETLALIGDVSEEERACAYMEWYERLMYQDFIVLGVPLNLYDIHYDSEKYKNLCKSIIAKSDAVVTLGMDKELHTIALELVEWAGSIGKKVLTREDLVK